MAALKEDTADLVWGLYNQLKECKYNRWLRGLFLLYGFCSLPFLYSLNGFLSLRTHVVLFVFTLVPSVLICFRAYYEYELPKQYDSGNAALKE